MIKLSREMLKAVVPGPVTPPRSEFLLQESLGGCPWRVAVASMLLCRTTRRQAEPVLLRLLSKYPGPEHVCRAPDLETVVRPCGLHRSRARQIARFSAQWLGDGWEDLRELSGVGVYVADAVGLVCFGCTDLECSDSALVSLKQRLEIVHLTPTLHPRYSGQFIEGST